MVQKWVRPIKNGVIENLHNDPNATETIICENTEGDEDISHGLIAGAVFGALIGISLIVVIAL